MAEIRLVVIATPNENALSLPRGSGLAAGRDVVVDKPFTANSRRSCFAHASLRRTPNRLLHRLSETAAMTAIFRPFESFVGRRKHWAASFRFENELRPISAHSSSPGLWRETRRPGKRNPIRPSRRT